MGFNSGFKGLSLFVKVNQSLQNVVFLLLSDSTASAFSTPTFRNTVCSIFVGGVSSCSIFKGGISRKNLPTYTAYVDGSDRVFRNVGIRNSDAGESPKSKNTTFRTRRKF